MDNELNEFEEGEINMKSVKDENIKKMKKNSEEKNKHHNNGYNAVGDVIKIALLIVSGFVLVLSVWIMFRSFSPEIKHSVPVLSYNVNNDVKYKVYLKKNDFYQSKYVGMGELLPSPFIDYIEIDFSSVIQSQKQLNYNYTYKVTGVLSAYYTGGEDKKGTIWTKNYSLVDPVSNAENNSSNLKLASNVKITYDTYNSYVDRYKLRAAIPMDADLVVNFTATAKANVDGSNENINETISSSVKIPLSVSTVNITADSRGTGSKIISNTEIIESSKNYVLMAISGVLFLIGLVSTIKLLIALKKMTENHSVLFKLNKILKDHASVVVEIDSVPRVRQATIIEVKQFKDMIDVQQELHLPILYHKSEELTENSFYIISGNQIYRYVINADMEQV